MNTVCIGRDCSMQRPIRVYSYVARRRTKWVCWLGPKGDSMRSHRVMIVPLHGLPGMNVNLVVYKAHHRQRLGSSCRGRDFSNANGHQVCVKRVVVFPLVAMLPTGLFEVTIAI